MWKYSKAFKRARQELLDDEQLQVGRLGRWSKRWRQIGRRLLLVHTDGDEGNNIPRVVWNDTFANWWGIDWSPDGAYEDIAPPKGRWQVTTGHAEEALRRCAGRRSAQGPGGISHSHLQTTATGREALRQCLQHRADRHRSVTDIAWGVADIKYIPKCKRPTNPTHHHRQTHQEGLGEDDPRGEGGKVGEQTIFQYDGLQARTTTGRSPLLPPPHRRQRALVGRTLADREDGRNKGFRHDRSKHRIFRAHCTTSARRRPTC